MEMTSDAPISFGSLSEQGLGSSTAFHAAFGFLIVVLSGLIQIDYQSTEDSPFDTHPSTMLAFTIFLVLHVVALVLTGHKTENKSCLPVLPHAVLISGALASALLLEILVPLFGFVMLILCVLVSVAISCVWCRRIFGQPAWADSEVFTKLNHGLRPSFRRLQSAVFQSFNESSMSCNSIEKEVQLPV